MADDKDKDGLGPEALGGSERRGRLAYEAYTAEIFRAFPWMEIVEWDDIGALHRQAWVYVANAVLNDAAKDARLDADPFRGE